MSEEMRVPLLKRRMQEKREEKRVLLLKRMLVMRQPMEEGMKRANRRAVKQAKVTTPQERMPLEKTPEERVIVLLEKRHRARTRRSNRQR